MARESDRWCADDLVISGRFARLQDWRLVVEEFAELFGFPCGVVVYSSRFALPSLSRLWLARNSEHPMLELLAQGLREETAAGASAPVAIKDLASELLGLTVIHLTPAPKHVGDLGVSALLTLGSVDSFQQAGFGSRLAACALGSIVAVAHRENAYEQVMRSIMEADQVDEPGELGGKDLARQTKLDRIPWTSIGNQRSRLVSYFADDLRDVELYVYVLRDGKLLLDASTSGSPAIPREVECLPSSDVGDQTWAARVSRWEGDRELPSFPDTASILRQSHAQERRLFGLLTRRVAMVAPFGAVPSRSERRREPSGLLLAIRSSGSSELLFSAAELSCLRALEIRLARSAADQRWFGTIAQLSARVQSLSRSRFRHPSRVGASCAAVLALRRDAQMSSGLVEQILGDLVVATGAISATCRLVVGVGPEVGVRHLARLAAAGGSNVLNSPQLIRIDPGDTGSVNSWVAQVGQACYLRKIPPPGSDQEFAAARERWYSEYPGLIGPAIFREDARSELCVPIFAEDRLVGTINLESGFANGFDESAHAVEEYAQVVGLAIRLARREISVEMLEEAEGFLDRRHSLEGELEVAKRSLRDETEANNSSRVREALAALSHAEEYLLDSMSGRERVTAEEHTTAADVVEAELRRLGRFRGIRLRLRDLLLDPESQDALDVSLDASCADALAFAFRQVLANGLDHGLHDGKQGHRRPRHWSSDVAIHVAKMTLGGHLNLVIGVENACFVEGLQRAPVERIFREPIVQGDGREHMGAFLAGEALRRCGGAASFVRAGDHNESTVLVMGELAIPLQRESPADD